MNNCRAFQRVRAIAPGQAVDVVLELKPQDFELVDVTGRRQQRAGWWDVTVGEPARVTTAIRIA